MAEGIIESMQILINGMKEYNIGKAIGTARESLENLKSSDLNEFDRRAAQNAIAGSTAQAIIGFGGSAEAAQQARMGFGAEPLNIQEEKLRATGKNTVAEATNAIQEQEVKAVDLAAKKKQQLEKELLAFKADQDIKVNAAKPKKLADFTSQDKNIISKSLESGKTLNDTIERVKKLSNTALLSPAALSRDKRLFDITRGNAIDIIKRLRSGAAVPSSEDKFYDNLLMNFSQGDLTPERLVENVNELKQGIRRTWESRVEVGEASGVSPEILNRYQNLGNKVFGGQSREATTASPLQTNTQAPDATPAPAPTQSWGAFFRPNK